jgi:F0F1-type ATP synthase membrane subunit b/b'
VSDTKALNNQIDALNGRLDYVEAKRAEAERALTDMERQRNDARREATYYRGECRQLADRGNAVHAIEQNLALRLAAHKRDAMPGDRIAAAAVIECGSVLEIVRSIIGGDQ